MTLTKKKSLPLQSNPDDFIIKGPLPGRMHESLEMFSCLNETFSHYFTMFSIALTTQN